MLHFLVNPWLLTALAGVSLPIIAHLLSRRRYDVVPWAAMQFLDPAKKTRRRMKLEELLLLLLRIGLITILVLAAARPWIPGGWLSGFRSSGSRSIVIVIDGSNSMTRTDGLNTLHQNAIRRAVEFLDSLGGGDEVAVIDCRDQPRVVIDSPLQDLTVVAEQLQKIPAPGGFSDLQSAIEQAIAMLGRSSAAAREVVVFTDRQRSGWMPDDEAAWLRVEEMLQFPAVRPRVWCIDVAQQLSALKENIAVGKIELSRELTVPGFPLRFRATLQNASEATVRVPVALKLDGQLLTEQKRDVEVPGKGEVTVEFEQTLRQLGTRVISVVAQPARDAIAADNESRAAVRVVAALPVLLVNGRPARDPVDRATFFAEVALSDAGAELPWVAARVVDADRVTIEQLRAAQVVVLADVADLPAEIAAELTRLVAAGNGVMICCGDNCNPAAWSKVVVESGLAPTVGLKRKRENALNAEPVRVEPLSLLPGWLTRFRSDPGRSFLKADFRSWWLVGQEVGDPAATPATDAADPPATTEPTILARLSSSDPLLLQLQCGKGTVLIMTSTLDRSWNDLPTRSDYVPFLHEALFAAVSSVNQRNLLIGQPLIAEVTADEQVTDAAARWYITAPANRKLKSEVTMGDPGIQLATRETLIPGLYQLHDDQQQAVVDSFIINYDPRENDAEELSDNDRARLITNDRLRFSDSLQDLAQQMYGDESRAELWAALMFTFLALLTVEVWMTRRIVQRGYGD